MVDQIIDWNLCLKLSNGDENFAKELLHLFFQSMKTDYQQIKQLHEEKKWIELGNQVHRFHGGLCYTGLPSLKSATKELESTMKTNLTEVDSAFLIFSQEIEKALAAWEHCPYRES